MSKDKCLYKSCGHPLGEWQPSTVRTEGFINGMIRTCEKCGGQQFKAEIVDMKLINAVETILKDKSE